MNKITAVVITKNEEKMIKDCLESLKFADKVIVVDSYSTDRTVEIARKNGAEVIRERFIDFSQIRNLALSKVKTKWVLFIDADERVSLQLGKQIKAVINRNENEFSAYSFMRKNYYLGRLWPYKEVVTKLFLTSRLKGYKGELHETPVFEGKVKKIKGDLIHFTHRTLEEMIEKTIVWSEIEARLRLRSGHPEVSWWRLLRVFFTGFINSYFYQKGYKAGSVGLIESIYQGFSMFITYARLWEMQKNQK